MTTNFSTIKFALSKLYCRGVSHGKNSVLDDFPLCPQGLPPPSKSENFIFIVVSPSLILSSSGARTPRFSSIFSFLERSFIGGFPSQGGFPLFSGKVRIVPRTLLGLFNVHRAGAFNGLRKRRKRTISDASFVLAVDVFLLTVRLFY